MVMIDTQHVTPLQKKKTQKPRVKFAYDDPKLYISMTHCITVGMRL